MNDVKPHLWLLFLLSMVLVGCAPAAPTQPDRPPENGATPTPLPTPEGWTRAAEPITLDRAVALRELGVLAMPEPPSTVFAHAIALDSSRVYGLNNNSLLGWDLLTGDVLFTVPREGATRVFVSPDRRRVYTLNPDGLIRVYASDNGAAIENFRTFETFNGVMAYDPLVGVLALGATDGAIQLWDMPARVSMGILRGASAPIMALSFHPDGLNLVSSDESGGLTVWNIETVQPVTTGSLPRPATALSYSPDGTLVVADTAEGAVRLDPQNLTVGGGLATTASTGLFTFAGDTAILMHGGGTTPLTLWNVLTGAQAATLPDTVAERVSAAASPDGALLMIGAMGDGASLWNLANISGGTILRGAFKVDDPTLRDLAWTPDGYQVLLFTTRGPIRVWGISP